MILEWGEEGGTGGSRLGEGEEPVEIDWWGRGKGVEAEGNRLAGEGEKSGRKQREID